MKKSSCTSFGRVLILWFYFSSSAALCVLYVSFKVQVASFYVTVIKC